MAELLNNILNGLEKTFGKYQAVQNLAQQTGQKPGVVVAGILGVVSVVLSMMFGLSALSQLLGIIPVYASFKALKTAQKDDDSQWLTYWIVFAVVNMIEAFFVGYYAGSKSGPSMVELLYYVGKIAFFQWAGNETTKGAKIVYEKAIVPVLEKLEGLLPKDQ